MESLLWAIDLALLAAFCFWAVREDGGFKRNAPDVRRDAKRQQQRQPQDDGHA